MPDEKKKYPPMKLEDEFRFGKHKGNTLEEVINSSPTYIRWAMTEGVIELDNDAHPIYEDAIEEWELENDNK